MSWNDPTGSGFHSQNEKTTNQGLREQINTLVQNSTSKDGWNEASAAVASSSTGKYDDKLMNDDHLNKMIDWLSDRQIGAEAAPADTSKPASNALTKAQAYVEASDDFRMSGGAVNQMAGDLTARDKFMENYKFNVKKRMEPGVANKYGNDALKAQFEGQNQLPANAGLSTRDEQRRAKTDSYAQPKVSKVAASIVGKNAGRLSV